MGMTIPTTANSPKADVGPLATLLDLAQARNVDLTTVSLAALADDFLHLMQTTTIAVNQQADFLVVAATLLLLKMRQVLPSATDEETEEIEQLEERLQEYHRYREQALLVRRAWMTHQLHVPARRSRHTGGELPEITGDQLARLMRRIIDALPDRSPEPAHLRPQGRSFDDCFAVLRSRLQELETATFQQLVSEYDRADVALSFMAALELTRSGHARLSQKQPFAPITVQLMKTQL